VFESTNRATFADFFPDDKEAAFANLILLSGGSAAVGFLAFPSLTDTYAKRWVMAAMTAVSGCIAMVCLFAAFRINEQDKINREKGETNKLIQSP